MKTTRYKFEQAVQEVNEESKQWLMDEFRSILESDKDFTRKADYIALSIASIDDKVASIDEEIKELQEYKKRLKSAKEIALTTGAEVFAEYGIAKIEGAGVSSITVTKPITKTKQTLEILNEGKLIKHGYYKVVLDEEEVRKELRTQEGKYKLLGLASLVVQDETTQAKLKINKRRSTSSNSALENNQEESAA